MPPTFSSKSFTRLSYLCQPQHGAAVASIETTQHLLGGILSTGLVVKASRSPPSITGTRSHLSFLPQRTFTTSQALRKKAGKGSNEHNAPTSAKSNSTKAVADDPFDFTELEANIAKAHAKLKEELSKLRGGGRFDTDLIDDLRVSVEKGTRNTVRLGDLAQVVPKGRVVNVIVGEKDHVKPVASAILGSDYSLNPQADADNPLQLNVTIPPPTAESRLQTVKVATKAAEHAANAVKNARQQQHKKLREMQMNRKARPDDIKKAGEKMDKIVDAGAAEVKKIADSAKKVLETA